MKCAAARGFYADDAGAYTPDAGLNMQGEDSRPLAPYSRNAHRQIMAMPMPKFYAPIETR